MADGPHSFNTQALVMVFFVLTNVPSVTLHKEFGEKPVATLTNRKQTSPLLASLSNVAKCCKNHQ